MEPLELIEKYYPKDSKAYHFLIKHSELVTQKALQIAARVMDMNPDIAFIRSASMLHDIGIFLTDDPRLGCFGDKPYLAHGYLGRELLEKEGLEKYALVCERHVGVGISLDDIVKNKLPLPQRDMLPITLEEKIICFADKFYSKAKHSLLSEKTVPQIRGEIAPYGPEKLNQFDEWLVLFKEPCSEASASASVADS
ncbi:MAG: HD domain-containing protein [Nitrospirae bacterium]|nr:HD domain-containing protein [Nitrospirota bacterium]